MKEQETYHPRIADKVLKEQLEAAGAVLIQGPKWCGKTTTAERTAASVIYMDHLKSEPSTSCWLKMTRNYS